MDNPIFDAIRNGDIFEVERLLEGGNSTLKDKTKGDEDTPLLRACFCGHIDMVNWLLDKGSDINETNYYGASVLFQAVAGGKNRMLEYLINKHGRSLQEKSKNLATLLNEAAYYGNISTMEYLVNRNASLNETNIYGTDSLSIAASQGQLKAVKWLVEEKNCDVKYKNLELVNVIGHAALGDHSHVLEYLLRVDDSFENVNNCDKDGDTPLLLSAYKCSNFNCIELLLSHGADINHVNNDGESFMIVLQNRNLEEEFRARRKSKQTKRVIKENEI